MQLLHQMSNLFNIIINKYVIDHQYKKGWRFGGQGWFLDKSYDILEHRFNYKHLSFIHLNIPGSEFVITGVYLHFLTTKVQMNQTLLNFLTITKEFKENNIPVLIIGDFNSDVNRSNKFDFILKN